jgi:hypothetical protein
MPGGDGTGPQGQGSMTGGGRGRGRGQGGGFAQGPDGECRCPNCTYKESHQLGVPCYNKKCPKCGAPMTRA